MKLRNRASIAIALGAVTVGAYFYFSGDSLSTQTMSQRLRGQNTVADRVNQFGPDARARWRPFFVKAGVAYPPAEIVILGLKQEKQLEIYVRQNENWRLIRALPIVKGSGKIGPKLREGDYQVPEGFYALESFNPNSAYHLSLRIGYPNAEDKTIGAREGRTENELGGDIMIHGGAASIGCLAMGDEAAEDLFVLAADTGRNNVQIVLSPLDFRESKLPADASRPPWLQERYDKLAAFVRALPNQ